ncbi:hypothetical protein [Allocoleopsis sp.]|uniref:hypothetical protein n=1 Tax=Allocoleopsis sp. TaxID=3088169 RepID=UPI002FD70776
MEESNQKRSRTAYRTHAIAAQVHGASQLWTGFGLDRNPAVTSWGIIYPMVENNNTSKAKGFKHQPEKLQKKSVTRLQRHTVVQSRMLNGLIKVCSIANLNCGAKNERNT